MNEREVHELIFKVIAVRDKRVKYAKLKELYCNYSSTNADGATSLFDAGIWFGLDDLTIRTNLDKLKDDIENDVWELLYWLEHTV